jgi:hypothetical protein
VPDVGDPKLAKRIGGSNSRETQKPQRLKDMMPFDAAVTVLNEYEPARAHIGAVHLNHFI